MTPAAVQSPSASDASPALDAALAPLDSALTRILAAVRAETDAIRQGADVRWTDFIDAKSRLLHELARLRDVDPGLGSERLRGLARETQDALRDNAEAIDSHLRASRHILGVLRAAAEAALSDGTYAIAGHRR